jgi:hypothetical protein
MEDEKNRQVGLTGRTHAAFQYPHRMDGIFCSSFYFNFVLSARAYQHGLALFYQHGLALCYSGIFQEG